MKVMSQARYWQLPAALKLVVLCFFLFSLNGFWKIGTDLFKFTINIGALIFGIVFWNLATGLINGNNSSRTWGVFLTFLGSLVWFFVFAIAVFEDSDPTTGLGIQSSLPHTQEIVFAGALLIINVGILFILMRPATKALFASQTNLENEH